MNIEAPHLAPLLDSLDRYPEIAEPIMRDAMYAALLSLIPDLATYPPQSPGTSYVRGRGKSEKLGMKWTAAKPVFSPQDNGFEAKIGNPVSYAGFVQGGSDDEPHQTQVMADKGWANVGDVLSAHQGDIDAYLEAALNRVLLAIKRAGENKDTA